MRRFALILFGLLVFPALALATPVNLSTFAPPSNPLCQLVGTDPAFNGGAPWSGGAGSMAVAVGDIITISMTVTGGTFTGPNILVINGAAPPQYNVTLPLAVTTSGAGSWSIQFVTPGCIGSNLTIVTH